MVETRHAAVLASVFAGVLLACAGAGAETSSWSSRVDPAAPIEKSQKKAGAPSPGFGAVKVIKAVPIAPEGTPLPAVAPPPGPGRRSRGLPGVDIAQRPCHLGDLTVLETAGRISPIDRRYRARS